MAGASGRPTREFAEYAVPIPPYSLFRQLVRDDAPPSSLAHCLMHHARAELDQRGHFCIAHAAHDINQRAALCFRSAQLVKERASVHSFAFNAAAMTAVPQFSGSRSQFSSLQR
jgi:hypothetical protein